MHKWVSICCTLLGVYARVIICWQQFWGYQLKPAHYRFGHAFWFIHFERFYSVQYLNMPGTRLHYHYNWVNMVLGIPEFYVQLAPTSTRDQLSHLLDKQNFKLSNSSTLICKYIGAFVNILERQLDIEYNKLPWLSNWFLQDSLDKQEFDQLFLNDFYAKAMQYNIYRFLAFSLPW